MAQRPSPRSTGKRRGIVNADVPSETLVTGLPDVGEGASAQHLGRDAVALQAGEGTEGPDAHKGPNSGAGDDASAEPTGRGIAGTAVPRP